MYLWDKEPRTLVYVQNKIAYCAPRNKNPKEMFTRGKPEFIHLNIFGYHVFIHVPREKRTKLDPSGKKGIFV